MYSVECQTALGTYKFKIRAASASEALRGAEDAIDSERKGLEVVSCTVSRIG